jgi:tripartite-type tricarboxylate transporter receptor subunit TctC
MCLVAAIACAAAPALAADDFRDKTIRLIIGSAPGGGHDAYARLTAKHLGAFLPGRPAFIVSNMPGASGVQAANYVYEIAPKDGTTIATFNRSMPNYDVIKLGKVRFHSKDFGWIGSLSQSADVTASWRASGVLSIEDAKKREVTVGAISKIGTMYGYPALLNATIGTRFKIVTGYESGTAVNLALESGEVQVRGSNPWSSYKAIHPDWIAQNKIAPLMQVGLRKEPDLPDTPLLSELAQNDEQRRMFAFLSDTVAIDQPYVLPPGAKPETLRLYRDAFNAMVADRGFLDEARTLNLDIEPLNGEKLAALVARIIDADADVVAAAVKYTGGE